MGRHSLIGQSCCGMMSKQSIDWFLESPSGMKFFPSERVHNQPWATRILYPFNKPIKSLYFPWFVVSVSRIPYKNRSIQIWKYIYCYYFLHFKCPWGLISCQCLARYRSMNSETCMYKQTLTGPYLQGSQLSIHVEVSHEIKVHF